VVIAHCVAHGVEQGSAATYAIVAFGEGPNVLKGDAVEHDFADVVEQDQLHDGLARETAVLLEG
jgi:hypothetical protein